MAIPSSSFRGLVRRTTSALCSKDFLKFVGSGLIAAVLHWLARWFLSGLVSYNFAVAFAYCIGMAVAFMLNRTFVFPDSSRSIEHQTRSFVLTNLAFFPVVWGTSVILARFVLPMMGVKVAAEGMAHALAIAVPVFATFFIHKLYTFSK